MVKRSADRVVGIELCGELTECGEGVWRGGVKLWFHVVWCCEQVPMPHTLDLSALRSTGLLSTEDPMADEDPQSRAASSAAPVAVEPDEAVVTQLISMGFSENGSKRAAVAVKNASAEACRAPDSGRGPGPSHWIFTVAIVVYYGNVCCSS